jgi:hypothetical protein
LFSSTVQEWSIRREMQLLHCSRHCFPFDSINSSKLHDFEPWRVALLETVYIEVL